MSQETGGPEDIRNTPSGKSATGLLLPAFIVFCIVGVAVALFLPAVRTAREPARRASCANNLKQIGMALALYEETYHALPPVYTVDTLGKPLHSWRTLILPWLGRMDLYDKIDFSRPWDDPANAAARKESPFEYDCASTESPIGHTTYLAIVTPNGCFSRTECRRLEDITDGLSETLMVVEVSPEQSVHWMSPVDADESLVLGLGPGSKLAHPAGMNGLFCDGSVKFLRSETSAEVRRAMISIAGNDRLSALD